MQLSHTSLQSAPRHGGLTLVEILVVLAVLGVIVAVAAPSLAGMMERRRVIAAAGELAGILNFAKSETNVLEDTLTLHVEPMPASANSSCARLVNQSSFDLCSCSLPASLACTKFGNSHLLREFLLPNSTGVTFSASATSPGFQNQLTFARNTALSIQNFGLTVTGQRTGAQLRVEYNSVGRVRTCSPGGSIGGFPVC